VASGGFGGVTFSSPLRTGQNNMIVWVVGTSSDNLGSDGDQRLHGYGGDTGAVVYWRGGGRQTKLMAGTPQVEGLPALLARGGGMYVAGANKVYCFF